ncbi:SLBB domain-containing protein [Rheinheimera baltica]|uniref:SLBB domain-containing protein n=1 Tax=Rheinheimera baltica TaxID=67576 RepID=UPI00273ED3D9|nr:SLBB domain-containing protein [Rheinheimera baltica]MDP5149825.1 SLBB domain-containing protein [Rheinheimera baltica]
MLSAELRRLLIKLSFFVFGCLLIEQYAYAVTPSPLMIEQLRKLPQSQQEALAKQYGFDLNLIRQNQESNANELDAPLEYQAPVDVVKTKANLPDTPEAVKRFGLDMFDPNKSSFAMSQAVPVPDNYLLGPDDSLQLNLFGKVNQQVILTVSLDGNVFIDEVGAISVAGLTFSDAKQLIQERIKTSLLGVNSVVSMGTLRTISILVTGEARLPGNYSVPALTTVTQALFVAGGVSEIGSLRAISVLRQGKTITRFDLYNLLLEGKANNDINLQNGDVVFIEPVKALAQVKGAVRRPAIFELRQDDTLASLLKMAGGITETGYDRTVVIERLNEQRQKVLINLDLSQKEHLSHPVFAGDILSIAEVSTRIENQVTLAGAVVRPGFYSWWNGMSVRDLVKSPWIDLHPTADLDYALILRGYRQNKVPDIIQFKISDVINASDESLNPLLQAGDLLLVFNYGNLYYERSTLNDYIKNQLQKRLNVQFNERWLLDYNLASKAFDLLQEIDTKTSNGNTVANMRIYDNVSKDIKLQNNNEVPEPLSYEAELLQQQDEIKQVTKQLLGNIFTDIELIRLTPHLSRKELLTPVLELIKTRGHEHSILPIVTITGEVKAPGDYPLTKGAGVSELLVAASGLTASASLSRAEITRFANSGSEGQGTSHINVHLSEILAGNSDVTMNGRDTLNIFATPGWNIQRVVEIRGEVTFPGRYPVKNGEMLSDVLKRAGGIAPSAFVKGAVLVREKVRESESLQVKKLIEQLRADVATKALSAERALISPQDAISMVRQLEKQTTAGRLVIDLQAIIGGDDSADLMVEDSDVLYIPRRSETITVIGEVQHAGTHRFKQNYDLSHYVQLAGGLRKRADDERIYVIKADGSVYLPGNNRWFSVEKQKLEAGDTIIVPLDTEYRDNLSLWTQVTQIIYQSAVALAAITSL